MGLGHFPYQAVMHGIPMFPCQLVDAFALRHGQARGIDRAFQHPGLLPQGIADGGQQMVPHIVPGEGQHVPQAGGRDEAVAHQFHLAFAVARQPPDQIQALKLLQQGSVVHIAAGGETRHQFKGGAMAGVHNRKAAPAGLLGGQLQPGRESLGGRRPFGGRQRIAYLAHSGGHVLAIETGGDRDLAQVGVGNALAAPEVARLLQQQVPQDFFELGVLQSHRQRQPDRGAKDSYQRGLRPFQAVLHGKVKGREARRSSVTAYAASGA